MSRLFIARRVLALRALALRISAPFAACLAALLAGCGSHPAPQAVLTARCMPISGAAPVELRVTPPARGPLRVAVEQRGISVVATLASGGAGKQGWTLSASSPIERFGVMSF